MPVLGRFANDPIERALAVRAAAVYQRRGGEARREINSIAATGERVCAAPGCAGRWMAPWKNRRRPIFEQQWGCSARCLATLVQAAVRREVGDGLRANTTEPHRHRVPLGLVLLAQGWITHPQLQTALQAQRASGRGRIGDWLTQGCGLEEERITRGLGVQWNCPVLAMDGFSPSAMALVTPKRFVAEFGMVPVRVAGSQLLYLAFQDQMDAATALGIEQMTGLRVESGLLSATQFERARASVLAADGVPVQMKLVEDTDALTAAVVRALEQRQPLAAKLVRVHQYYWLRLWLEAGAMQGAAGLPGSAQDVEDHVFLLT